MKLDQVWGGKGARIIKLKTDSEGYIVPNFAMIAWNKSLSETFIEDKIKNLKGTYFAVRSSANVEDNKQFSFAGLFLTELYVTKENILASVQRVRESVHSQQVKEYCLANEIPIEAIKMNVVIQEIVSPDVSGVVFSKQPLLPEINEVVISSVYGLGVGLVNGDLNADQFIGIQDDWDKTISEKKNYYSFEDGRVQLLKVPLHKQLEQSLTNEQCAQLEQIAVHIEELFGAPQDIEFAYKDEVLYILQSRDITNLPTEPLKVWDNSNIVESYPGITLPFTYSFILQLYETVYQNIGLLLGVRKQQIDANQDVFKSMLGHIKGRVYYDLENWYKALSMLPAYKLNAPLMEKMMGVSKPLRKDFATNQPLSKIQARWQLFLSFLDILEVNRQLSKDKDQFTQMISDAITKYHKIDYSELPTTEIWQHYKEFRKILIDQWNPPLANDLLAMFYFGSLEKFCAKHFEEENLHLELIVGRNEVHSTKPAHLLEEIIETAQQENRFEEIQTKDYHQILEQIKEGNFGKTGELFNTYIHEFGDRFVGELKLENDTFRQQPERLLEIIASYDRSTMNKQPLKSSSKDLEPLLKKLPITKRWWFKYLVKKAGETVADRENLRLERTKVFGMVRVFCLAIGEKFVEQNLLEHKKDFFYLTEQEVDAFITSDEPLNLKQIVAQRKQEFQDYENYQELPNRIYQRGTLSEDVLQVVKEQTDGQLSGLPCSPGIVKAPVVILNEPNEVESLNGAILVTKSTDPGWITIFKSASAILVERGSALSHSAIVSRELGIPCIVAVKGITDTLTSGDVVEMNGTTGTIKIIEKIEHIETSN